MIEPIEFSDDSEHLLVIGYLLDNIVKFSLLLDKATNKIIATTDKLLIIELLEGIEVEVFDRLASPFLHYIDLSEFISKMRVELVSYSQKDRLYGIKSAS